jgi:hypothetical protein
MKILFVGNQRCTLHFLICSIKRFVISTEAEPSGEIWLRTKSKFSQNPDVSMEPALSAVERARHDIENQLATYHIRHTQYAIRNTT